MYQKQFLNTESMTYFHEPMRACFLHVPLHALHVGLQYLFPNLNSVVTLNCNLDLLLTFA